MATQAVSAFRKYGGAAVKARRARATFTTDFYSARNYVSPPHVCSCRHDGPRHLLPESALPALTFAVACFYCGTVLGYVDQEKVSALERFQNLLHRHQFVTRTVRCGGRRQRISHEAEANGVGRRLPGPVLRTLVRLGLDADLTWDEVSAELGMSVKKLTSLVNWQCR